MFVFRMLWEGVKRLGRVTLWILLPPIGLWRSWRHGRRRRDAELASTFAAELDRHRRRPLRDATPAELFDEPDAMLEAIAAGDVGDVTDRTRELARVELERRRVRS